MKKSFLNRAMAAAIAVPVALSQTVLFASFAAGETATTATESTVFNIDTFLNVPVENSKVSPITQVADNGDTLVYEKNSIWNSKLATAMNTLESTNQALDTESVLNSIGSLEGKWYKDVLVKAISANAEIADQKITVTFDVNFDEEAQALLKEEVIKKVVGENSTLEESIVKNYITTDVPADSFGKITLTIDTANLNADGSVSYTVSAVTDAGEIKTVEAFDAYLDSKIKAYRDELVDDAQLIVDYYQEKLDEASSAALVADYQKQLDDAHYLMETAIDKMVNNYYKQENKLTNKLTNLTTKEFAEQTQSSYDDALAAVSGQLSTAKTKIPDSVDALVNSATVNKVYNEVLKQLNSIISAQGYAIDVTLADIANVAKTAEEVTVTESLVNGKGSIFTEAYLADVLTEAESEYYYSYFEELLADKLAAENKEIKDITTKKMYEANIGADYSTLSGSADLAIKRIITVTLEDVQESTEESTEESVEDSTEESVEDSTEESVEDSTEESETETRPVAVEDITFDVDGDVDTNTNFYFSHDARPFDVADLIRKATYTETTTLDGETTSEVVDVDLARFAFGTTADAPVIGLSPKDVFTEENPYELTRLYIFYQNDDGSWSASDAELYVYIGVKGDANLNGEANAADAASILKYAAAIGAGEEAFLTTDEQYDSVKSGDALEAFAWFLADVSGESKDSGATSNNPAEADGAAVNAGDSASILKYAAVVGSEGEANWVTDVFRATNAEASLPKYTEEIYNWELEHPTETPDDAE